MKKILSITLVSATALLLTVGCSSKQDGVAATADKTQEKTVSQSADAISVKGMNNKKVCKAISTAAKKTDWRLTKFKRTMLLAEKIVGDKTASVTIEFGHGHIDFYKDSSTLGSDYDKYEKEFKDAIRKEFENAPTSH